MSIKDYESVIGLEVHAELKTKTKIFCDCSTEFGAEPNTQCCPICMGMPGTLPVLNKEVVRLAVKAGLALNCSIEKDSKHDRKNYFYPDLPKAYQISQYDRPICGKGFVDIETEFGTKRIGITRIHIEEDAGKLIHDENGTLIDCNRCGIPLIEIVSEPDIRTADEAVEYVRKLKNIIECANISDCKMNEGSLRCDINLSVRKKGETTFGIRTEMKNLNSFKFIKKAIEFEFARQVEAIENGEKILRETRRFDEHSGKTFSMRTKEDAADYRFYREPDLPRIELTDIFINEIKAEIPELPDEKKMRFMEEFGLNAYDAEMLISNNIISNFYENAVKNTAFPKTLANLMISELPKIYTEGYYVKNDFPAEYYAEVADLLGKNEITSGTAKMLMQKISTEGIVPSIYIEENDLKQINDEVTIKKLCLAEIENDPKSVADYKNGKKTALKALMGKIMRTTSGRANPNVVQETLTELLK